MGQDAPSTRFRSVVLVMVPEYSAVNATFALARHLSARGMAVTYLGPASGASHVVRQGFAYSTLAPWWPYDATADDEPRDAASQQTRQSFRVAARHYARTLESFGRWLDRQRPSLVLLDTMNWMLAPPVLERGIPVLTISITLASPFNAAVPPVFSDVVPARVPRLWHKLRNVAAWARPMRHVLTRSALMLAALWGTPQFGANPFRLIRRHRGRLRWGEYGPRLAVPELVAAPRALDFPEASMVDRFYLGISVDEHRDDGEVELEPPDGRKPLIYCSLGTYSAAYRHAPRLFRAVVDAVRAREDWTAIIQVGAAVGVDDFATLPSRIHVTSWAPQLRVLRRASVFITHGGSGAVREAIYFGVPMIVFPCWCDQPGNAARVVYHRIGVVADISKVTSETVGRLIDEIVRGACTRAIRRMRDRVRREESERSAVDWIASIAGRARHVRGSDEAQGHHAV